MASAIWNEKEQRWVLRLSINGTRKKFTSNIPGQAGKRDVMKRAREFKESGLRRSVPTVSSLFDEFLADASVRVSPEQLKNLQTLGRLYILPQVGSKKFNSMSVNDWQQILNNAKGERVKNLSHKSIDNIRSVICSLYKFAYRCGLVPTKEIDLYVPNNHPATEKVILQREHVERLFSDEFASNWYINYFRFLFLTGLRPGEGLGLKWSDITSDYVLISRAINNQNRITDGKNKNARRFIPLTNLAKQVINKQREQSAHLGSDWVFCDRFGGISNQHRTYKYFRKITDTFPLAGASPYSLRHTFISWLQYEVPEQMLKSVVGHSVSMDTYGTYAHNVDHQQEQLGHALNDAFSAVLPDLAVNPDQPAEIPKREGAATVTRLRAN